MIEHGWGRIIWMSSQSGVIAIPGQPVYCSSKGAVIQAVKTLGVEWAKYGITVNSIAPTFVETDLTRKDVNAVLDSLSHQISKSLGRRGAGAFTLPGLVKIEKRRIPARKARKGVPNPFKPGELMDVKAKPATTKVKVRALKALKDMV